MAYSNSPGRLPPSRSPYSDISSMYIGTPHAGHVDASPYTQEQNSQRVASVGSPELPPAIYSGMSSMQISSPYQSHASLPPNTQASLMHTPTDQNLRSPFHPSNYTGVDGLAQAHTFMSSTTMQHLDQKPMIENRVDGLPRRRRSREEPMSFVGHPHQDVAALRHEAVKNEDLKSLRIQQIVESRERDARLQKFLQINEAEDREIEEELAEFEAFYLQRVSTYPNIPRYRESLERIQSKIRVFVEAKNHHYNWVRQYREAERQAGRGVQSNGRV
ncbi:hypothetical protein DENSPDRAFT_514490 [Dentipellis sp. KUC8613]|nr:hypothetical protein DENSPDRAFT_514490 [Dentipellis sp. KUC8613]